jgi:beta-galactosidase
MDLFQKSSRYLTKNNEPWIPMMGECHYSRLDERLWKPALTKMKAGGIEVVSTYAIWIHHEEIEGEFNFEGRRDLRQFVTLCQEVGLYVFLRIGPWCHGEVRNGGFPDWLVAKEQDTSNPIKLRYNDPNYLTYVDRFFHQIGEVCEGLILSQDGPIIGIQIENEYGHAGGYQGEEGNAHMKTLTERAKAAGLIVPFYTATAWGGACTGGLIPVFGGYCEAPWDSRTTELEPNENYSFKSEMLEDGNPYLTAELGGGLQVTGHRRPVIEAKDIGSMALVKLGSGANGLGFYMYHGGTNPKGFLTTLQESKATGYANDYSIFSYDFQAPIGEFGNLRSSYYEIKAIAEFIKSKEVELATSTVYIPSEPGELRFSIRYIKGRKEFKGFLFYNQYHRHQKIDEVVNFSIKETIEGDVLMLPPLSLSSGSYGVIEFTATHSVNGYEGHWTKQWPLSDWRDCDNEDDNVDDNEDSDSDSMKVNFKRMGEDEARIIYQIELAENYTSQNASGMQLEIEYQGDQIQIYQGEEMIHDSLYSGVPYRLDLEIYGFPNALQVIIIKPQKEGCVYYEPGYEPKDITYFECRTITVAK